MVTAIYLSFILLQGLFRGASHLYIYLTRNQLVYMSSAFKLGGIYKISVYLTAYPETTTTNRTLISTSCTGTIALLPLLDWIVLIAVQEYLDNEVGVSTANFIGSILVKTIDFYSYGATVRTAGVTGIRLK